MNCCVCLTVVSGDTKANLQKLEADMVKYAAGRRLPDTPAADPFDYYALAFGGVPVTSGTNPKTGQPVEVRVGFLLGYNLDVAQTVLGEIVTIQPYAVGTLAVPPAFAMTRATLLSRLHQKCLQSDGIAQVLAPVDRVWDVKPGDDVVTGVTDVASLLAKFTPVTLGGRRRRKAGGAHGTKPKS